MLQERREKCDYTLPNHRPPDTTIVKTGPSVNGAAILGHWGGGIVYHLPVLSLFAGAYVTVASHSLREELRLSWFGLCRLHRASL